MNTVIKWICWAVAVYVIHRFLMGTFDPKWHVMLWIGEGFVALRLAWQWLSSEAW